MILSIRSTQASLSQKGLLGTMQTSSELSDDPGYLEYERKLDT